MPTTSASAPVADLAPSAAGDVALSAEGVAVRYGRHRVVERLDLELRRGQVYALLGRNGCGKSSLLRTLLGLQPADGGRLRLLGRDPFREHAALMDEVGYVPEEPQAPPEMTPTQLARFCGRLHSTWNAETVAARFRRFEVPTERPFRQLSKGQKKQVELALALGHAPALVVLDDPTLGLDPVARKSFFGELMAELASEHPGGTTVLLATHDLDAVEGIAERVGILAGGRLVVDEPLEGLKARFRRLLLPVGREASVATLRPVRTETKPWGVEVTVAEWGDEQAATHGEGRMLSLDEIFAALAPKEGER
jgi:ABC-type multidrug transport system ATPase subunit